MTTFTFVTTVWNLAMNFTVIGLGSAFVVRKMSENAKKRRGL